MKNAKMDNEIKKCLQFVNKIYILYKELATQNHEAK